MLDAQGGIYTESNCGGRRKKFKKKGETLKGFNFEL